MSNISNEELIYYKLFQSIYDKLNLIHKKIVRKPSEKEIKKKSQKKNEKKEKEKLLKKDDVSTINQKVITKEKETKIEQTKLKLNAKVFQKKEVGKKDEKGRKIITKIDENKQCHDLKEIVDEKPENIIEIEDHKSQINEMIEKEKEEKIEEKKKELPELKIKVNPAVEKINTEEKK